MMTLTRRHTLRLISNNRRGLTLMEMVVAITIVLVIMAGVVASFIQLLDSHDQSRARMEATANARAALETLSAEVKRARNTTGTLTFVGQCDSIAGGGDRVDQDQDGNFDEEELDGADNDGDWVLATSDRHALIPEGANTYAERPVYYKEADLGDAGIDEDIGATSSTLQFDTYDVPGDPLERHVSFYIGTDPDGQPNTLMRVISGIDPVTSTSFALNAGPVCHNVVSFGALFWDHTLAKDPNANPWRTSWPPPSPQTVAPSSVYLTVSVYAGTPLSLQELPATKQIETVTLSTIVNVEAVLADPNYVAQRTPITPVTP